MSANLPMQMEPGPASKSDDGEATSLIDLMMARARGKLDDIAEPSLEDLAAMEELEEPPDIDIELGESESLQPALALLAELDEPEVLSLEGLDEAEAVELDGDELDDVDELLEDVESLIDDFIDVDLDDKELDDEGYDLDDDDDGSYDDLYGDDDTIIPSFREGEFVEDEENDTDYFVDLR